MPLPETVKTTEAVLLISAVAMVAVMVTGVALTLPTVSVGLKLNETICGPAYCSVT